MFEPLNLIERRLVEAADDPERRVAFGQRLLSEKLYVSPLGPPDASGQMPGLRAVPLVSRVNAVALFTAPERVRQACGPTALILVKDGRTLFDWLAPGPFVLNPGSELTAILTTEDVTALLAGEQQPIAPRLSHLDFAPPPQMPPALGERLNRGLSALPAVNEAWLMAAQREHAISPHWVLGVAAAGPWPAVQAAIATALQGYNFGENALEVVPLDSAGLATFRAGLPVISPRG